MVLLLYVFSGSDDNEFSLFEQTVDVYISLQRS